MKTPAISLMLTLVFTQTAQADWDARPAGYTYDTAFAECIQTGLDTVNTCIPTLATAYTLRREITYALLPCILDPDAQCTEALAALGITARDFDALRATPCALSETTLYGHYVNGIEVTDPAGPDSCIEQMARLIEARDAQPTWNTSITCGVNYIECGELTEINRVYWRDQALATAQELGAPERAEALEGIENAAGLCRAEQDESGWGAMLDVMICESQIYAAIALR